MSRRAFTVVAAAAATTVAGCGNGRASRVTDAQRDAERTSPPFTVYHLGATFERLPVTAAVRDHVGPDPAFPELVRRDDVTYLYGEVVGDGTLPPIEVQSSPFGQKNADLYADPPFRRLQVKGVPAAAFDDGRILEIYAGDTTITVYGHDPAQVLRAPEALRAAAPSDVPPLGRPLAGRTPAADAVDPLQRLPRPEAIP